MTRRKNPRGTVAVQAIQERLRLCWSYQGKRYYLSLGLPDSQVNRKVAEAKAKLIERDMAVEVLDKTLARYRSEYQQNVLTVVELFERFITYKAKTVLRQSLIKYRGLLGHLKTYFKSKAVVQIGEREAEQFCEWLSKQVQPITVRERVSSLKSCWYWAIKKQWATVNSEIKQTLGRAEGEGSASAKT